MRKRALVVAIASALMLIPASAMASGAEEGWCSDKSDIAILGASSETGYGSTGYSSPDEGYSPTRYGWTSKVMHNLNVTWATEGHNYAHNGALVRDFFPGGRWSDAAGATANMGTYQPGLVVINLGGNEYVTSTPPAVFEEQLRRLVTAVRTEVDGANILFLTYPAFQWSSAQYPWGDYGGVIARVAATTGSALIDLRQHVDGSWYDAARLWHSDRVHLNDSGQSVVAAAVWGWLVAAC